jgi:hypothetical protein
VNTGKIKGGDVFPVAQEIFEAEAQRYHECTIYTILA